MALFIVLGSQIIILQIIAASVFFTYDFSSTADHKAPIASIRNATVNATSGLNTTTAATDGSSVDARDQFPAMMIGLCVLRFLDGGLALALGVLEILAEQRKYRYLERNVSPIVSIVYLIVGAFALPFGLYCAFAFTRDGASALYTAGGLMGTSVFPEIIASFGAISILQER